MSPAYIVAATPRTGSSLLCEGLEATGIAGRPAEVFAPDFRDMWLRQLALDPDVPFSDYLSATRRYGTTANGVYGLKIQWMHVATLAQEVSFDGESADVLLTLYPGARFINIQRRDRKAQAISWYKAIVTNEWWRYAETPSGPPVQPTVKFDEAFVRALEADLERQQSAWEDYFRQRRLKQLVIEYEVLAEQYREEIERALRFLELDAAAARSIPAPQLVRQADQVNSQWRTLMDAERRA